MKVLVIGADGQVGRLVMERLAARGDIGIAGLHAGDNDDWFTDNDWPVVPVDLLTSPETIAGAMIGCEAVIFAAGSGSLTSDAMTLRIDLDGAVKAMQAARIAAVDRFVMISMLFAEDRNRWADPLKALYVAKFYADDWLTHRSGLAYTIVEPGALSFKPGTGRVKSDPLAVGSVTREDLAAFLVACLHAKQTVNRTIPLLNGDDTIETVIGHLA